MTDACGTGLSGALALTSVNSAHVADMPGSGDACPCAELLCLTLW